MNCSPEELLRPPHSPFLLVKVGLELRHAQTIHSMYHVSGNALAMIFNIRCAFPKAMAYPNLNEIV